MPILACLRLKGSHFINSHGKLLFKTRSCQSPTSECTRPRHPRPQGATRPSQTIPKEGTRSRHSSLYVKIAIVLERETEIAKVHLKEGNKPLALLALKKKKYQESLLESTNTQLLNLEQLVPNQNKEKRIELLTF